MSSIDKTTIKLADQYDTPERLGAGLEKAMNGFKPEPVEQPTRDRWIKNVILHGFNVQIVDRRDGDPCVTVELPPAPMIESPYSYPAKFCSSSFFYDIDDDASKARAFNAAMSWADKMALGYYAMKLALYAVDTEPHYVASDGESEPWVGLARTVVHQHKGEAGLYVAELTADMVSPEVGPCKGGEITIHSEPGDFEIRESTINCELAWSMDVGGGKWLAVYDFSEVI